MATSLFDDKQTQPTAPMRNEALKDAAPLWDRLCAHILTHHQTLPPEWKFYSKKAGWTYVFRQKKRALCYLIPCDGFFMVALVFSNNAVQEALLAPIGKELIVRIKQAPQYAEGRSFFADVSSGEDLEAVYTLLRIKDAH